MTPQREEESFWNERYAGNNNVYGLEPNAFFAQELSKLKPGKLWLPADGEGRNSVFAALQGWDVDAFDFSNVAREKALAHAKVKRVSINYEINDIYLVEPPSGIYDVIALTYVHLKSSQRKDFHSKCICALRKGGTLILEAFTPEQLDYQSGGPKVSEMLYTPGDLEMDFKDLTIQVNERKIVFLQEGKFHQGNASVLRFVGKR